MRFCGATRRNRTESLAAVFVLIPAASLLAEDMIYSGHTYFTILYILALCELLRKVRQLTKRWK